MSTKANQTAPEPGKPSHPLDFVVGKRIVLQRGPITYIGKLTAITKRWLVLSDAEVIGNNRSVCVPEVWVNNDCGQIGHFHLEAGGMPNE